MTGDSDKYFGDPVAAPMFNRALGGYAPGSTFKTFVSLGTLKYGIRAPDETYYDDGCFEFGNDEEACNAGDVALGIVDLRARAHGVERRVLLQRRQRVLERLPRRGR